jgi:hypothetical protein
MSFHFLFFIFLMMLSVKSAWSLTGARLISLSKSGQTVVFNLGLHDGVKEGDYAVVIKEIQPLDAKGLRLVPVARARNIKINTTNSVWILFKMIDEKLLEKGEKYLVLSESHMLSGRRDPRFGRISVVTNELNMAQEVHETLADDHDRLSKLKHQYPELIPLHQKEYKSDNDIDIVDVEKWGKHQSQRYRSPLYKSPHQDEFRRQLRLLSFEKLVTAYLKKVNDPQFNYDQFYDEQMKSESGSGMRVRSSFSTEYEEYLALKAKKKVEDARLYRSLLEKGESWSEEFSDEELKVVLNEVSVLQEKDRRDYIVQDQKRFCSSINYGVNLTDAQTNNDSTYRRSGPYSWEFDFEGVPLLGHSTLERLTLNGGVRVNKSAMEAGGYNASVDELSAAFGLNWYPVYSPSIVEAPTVFMGVYVRSGHATVEAPQIDQKGNYTFMSLPGLKAGMRYNFKNKLGLRVAFTMESLNLNRYEQSSLTTVLPEKATLFEAKMNFGLAYSF